MEDTLHTVTINHTGTPITLSVRTDRYVYDGGLAVLLYCQDGELYTALSVNVDDISLAADEFVCKTYTENEGLLEALVAAGVVVLTGDYCDIGPICRLVQPREA